MKRPQGFERPPAPAQSAAGPAARSKLTARRPRKPATVSGTDLGTDAGAGAGAGVAGDAVTEPIILPSRPAVPERTDEPDRSHAPERPAERSAGDRSAGDRSADARKQLRAARRARRKYERDEVRRFTWRTRRRRRSWLIALGATAALAVFVIVGAFSPLMALRTIEVVGTNRVPADQVKTALAGQLGTPLPLVDLNAVKKSLSGFTLIRSYVTESRPPGTLVVRIVEREPVGLLASAAGFDLVDAAGVVIQSAAERPAGYPLIEATGGVGKAGFLAAADVVGSLPDGIRSQLETVTAATKDDVTLTLAGGVRVVWGSAEKSEYKAVVLGALMVGNPVGSVGEYDVSSPDSAVIR